MEKTFSVILTVPGAEPMSYRLVRDRVTLGRASGSDIRLQVPSISSRHGILERNRGGGYRIVDSGSKNGTRINGQRVMDPKGMALKNGDRLLLGETVEGHFVEAIEAEPVSPSTPGVDETRDVEVEDEPLSVWVDASEEGQHPEEEINPVAAAVARQQESGSVPVTPLS